MLLLAARCRGVVVITDARGLRSGHDQGVVSMKKDEIRGELLGLCQREREGLLVGWYLGGEENSGGFTPTWLQCGCHGNLVAVRSNGCRFQEV